MVEYLIGAACHPAKFQRCDLERLTKRGLAPVDRQKSQKRRTAKGACPRFVSAS